MVSRQSDTKDFGRVNQPGIQQTRIGNAPIDENQFRTAGNTRTTPAPESGGFDLMDSLLRVIAPAAKQLENANFEVEKEKSYLRGQAAAATQLSEESIEADPLTRDWARAGYRDTVGKLAAADSEAQLATDMARLRQEPPEKFAEYLAQRRESLADQHGSMSLPARKAMFTQQLTSDQAAIAKHSNEHKKFIADMQLKQLKTTVQTEMSKLDSARKSTDASVYATAARNTFEVIRSSLFENERVPPDVRTKLTEEVMAAALETGHISLFTAFREVEVPFSDGSKGSLFSRLDFPAQEKLTKAHEGAEAEVQHIKSDAAQRQLGVLEIAIANNEAVSASEASVMLYAGAQNKYWTYEKANSVLKDIAKVSRENETSIRAHTAFLSGDISGMSRHGSVSEVDALGVKTERARMAKAELPLGERQSRWLALGTEKGSTASLKEFATNLEGPLRLVTTLPKGAKMDIGNAQIVQQAVAALDERSMGSERYGNALMVINASLGPEQAEKLAVYRDALSKTSDPVLAATQAGDEIARRANMTPEMKAAAKLVTADQLKNIQSEMNDPGMWTGFKDKFLETIGVNNARMATGQDYTFWSSSRGPAARESALLRTAVMHELYMSTDTHPSATESERKEMAQAAVFRRAVPVGTGYLLTPPLQPGKSMQSLFGLGNENFDPAIIGQAVEKLSPLRDKDNYRVWSLGSSNTITWQEYTPGSPDPIPGGARALDMATVGQQARALRAEQANRDNSVHGAGVTAKVGDGQVTFNGTHSVPGLPSDWMLQYRKDLIKFEGYTSTPKDAISTSGKTVKVVGAGIASTNSHYPKYGQGPGGSITKGQLDGAFHAASNDAANIGMRVSRQMGMSDNPAAFQLFSQMAYQTNDITAPKKGYEPFLRALRSGNAELAKAEFRKQPVWADAQGRDKDGKVRSDTVTTRNQYYLGLIEKISTKPKGREVVGVIN